jgi:hypothetical protein
MRAKLGPCAIQPNLSNPSLVPSDLPVDVKIGRVV